DGVAELFLGQAPPGPSAVRACATAALGLRPGGDALIRRIRASSSVRSRNPPSCPVGKQPFSRLILAQSSLGHRVAEREEGGRPIRVSFAGSPTGWLNQRRTAPPGGARSPVRPLGG